MKKFIALGAALVTLLFCFVPSMNTADVNAGVAVCEDLEPNPNLFD